MAIHTIGYDAAGNVGDYSTIASFLADLGTNVISGDTAHVMYADPEKSPYWRESFGRVGANHFNVDVLYDSVCFLKTGGEFYAVRYDLGGETIIVKNVRLVGGATLLENYALTNGTLIAENCMAIGCTGHIFYGRVSSNLMICRNCLVVSPTYSGFYMTAANRCTVIDGASRGFRYGSADHCLSICYGANVCFESVSPKLYCVSNDASAGTSNGCISNYDYSTLKMQIDNNIRNPFDFRLRPDSDLIGVGGTIDSDVPLDIDGQTRTTPDTPGFSIGVYLEESTDPGESNVLAPTPYKINGVNKTGTYSPDFPDVGSVIESDTVNGSPGTYHEATPAEVQLGVTFGPAETYTGTYNPVGSPPTIPTLTLTDNEDESGFTAAFSGADANTTNSLEYKLASASAWTSDPTTKSGASGSQDVSTPSIGLYYVRLTSTGPGGSVQTIGTVIVSDGSRVPPSKVLAEYLIGQAIFSNDMSADWALFVSSLPDKPTKAGVVYDTDGLKDGRIATSGESIIHHGVQLRVRSNDYVEGFAKIEDAVNLISTIKNISVVIGSKTYIINSVSQTSSIISLGVEEGTGRRISWTCNFLMTLTVED